MRRSPLLVVCCLLSLGACQRDEDAIRVALASREAAWRSDLATLKAQHAALKQRLSGGVTSPSAAESRTRTTLDGVGQSLVDVETQVRQVAPRVEQGIARGGAAAQKALDEEGARMTDYLRGLASDLTAAGQELDALAEVQRNKAATSN